MQSAVRWEALGVGTAPQPTRAPQGGRLSGLMSGQVLASRPATGNQCDEGLKPKCPSGVPKCGSAGDWICSLARSAPRRSVYEPPPGTAPAPAPGQPAPPRGPPDPGELEALPPHDGRADPEYCVLPPPNPKTQYGQIMRNGAVHEGFPWAQVLWMGSSNLGHLWAIVYAPDGGRVLIRVCDESGRPRSVPPGRLAIGRRPRGSLLVYPTQRHGGNLHYGQAEMGIGHFPQQLNIGSCGGGKCRCRGKCGCAEVET